MFEQILNLAHTVYNVEGIITWGGILVITLIIFAETGLLLGFFLPGDSLLITAGILSAAGHLNLAYLLIFPCIAAIIGDQVGYLIGHHLGKRLYSQKESLLFHKSHLEKAQAFYDKHGPKTIVLARFIPIVRTFAPTVAGAASMNYRTFTAYNIAGGVFWVFSTVLGGYFLGRLIPDLDKYIHVVIGAVILLSFVPILIEFYQHKKNKNKKK